MSCPITSAYIRVIDKHYMDPEHGRWILNEEYSDQWAEIQQRAQVSEPAVVTKRLRAFFCVELLYRGILPMQTVPAGPARDIWKQLVTARYERSYEGLTQLMGACEALRREVVLTQGEMAMDGVRTSAFRDLTLLKRVNDSVTGTEEAARALRPFLRGPVEKIGVLGTRLGRTLTLTAHPFEACMHYAHTMLDVSLHNPVSPWTMNLKTA